ncbi:hypothetical protein SHIRM173S_13347 [Streptomyces hirsutus]
MTVVTDGVYVYAILRAGTALPKGLGGVGSPPAPVRTIGQGPLDAVVSDAPPSCARDVATCWRTRNS